MTNDKLDKLFADNARLLNKNQNLLKACMNMLNEISTQLGNAPANGHTPKAQ